jgi:thioredoxin reductase
MTQVTIVGDGPAGLSAGLLLAKNGAGVDVFGIDNTPMHKALLKNYLGIREMDGPEFQEIARDQVREFGGAIHDVKVKELEETGEGFTVETEEGDRYESDYLILATTNEDHQRQLGVERENGHAAVDRDGHTNIDRCYAVGWAARTDKIQAIISAGDGAAAGVDILSREKGEAFHDFDVL